MFKYGRMPRSLKKILTHKFKLTKSWLRCTHNYQNWTNHQIERGSNFRFIQSNCRFNRFDHWFFIIFLHEYLLSPIWFFIFSFLSHLLIPRALPFLLFLYPLFILSHIFPPPLSHRHHRHCLLLLQVTTDSSSFKPPPHLHHHPSRRHLLQARCLILLLPYRLILPRRRIRRQRLWSGWVEIIFLCNKSGEPIGSLKFDKFLLFEFGSTCILFF